MLPWFFADVRIYVRIYADLFLAHFAATAPWRSSHALQAGHNVNVASIEAEADSSAGKPPEKIVVFPQLMHSADIEFVPASNAITL
jgi:hypothetical protein